MAEDLPAYLAPTFAERQAARLKAEKAVPAQSKAVDSDESEVEDKVVATKSTTRKSAKKTAKKA